MKPTTELLQIVKDCPIAHPEKMIKLQVGILIIFIYEFERINALSVEMLCLCLMISFGISPVHVTRPDFESTEKQEP